jgi:hypothetical protein
LTKKEKASSMKQADFRVMLKKASKSVCTSMAVVLPDPLFPTPSTSSAMKTPKNIAENSKHPEPTDGGDIQMGYCSN